MRLRSTPLILVVACSCQTSPTPEPAPLPAPPESTPPAAAAESAPPATPEGPKEKLLVMPLKAESGSEASTRALDEMILEAIHDLGRYEVLGPEDLDAVLGVEKLKDAMGCDDMACAAEIGGALGAPYLVAGQLTRLGEQVVLSLRLMDTTAPAVLERATARGSSSAAALTAMMAQAVGDLFHSEVTTAAPTVVEAPASPGYAEYTALMNRLGRRMANNEYTQMLDELDGVDAKAIRVPAGVSLGEILLYYRVAACAMLKRGECLRRSAAAYLRQWPDGMYASSVQTFVEQLDDEKLQRRAKAQEVKDKLEEFARKVKEGSLTPLQAKEASAAVLMGARDYDRAASLYRDLVGLHSRDPDKAMDLVGMLALALQYAGKLDEARRVLLEARRRQPRLFRLKGLHQRLRTLPR